MKKTYCCSDMLQGVENGVIHYNDVFDEYGIPFIEDGVSYALISHCPWCGGKLPESKRLEWFEELERLGYEAPLLDDSIPEAYKSAKWRM